MPTPSVDIQRQIPFVVFKTGAFEYIIVTVFCAPLILLYLLSNILHPSISNAGALLLVVTLFGFVYLWFLFFRIEGLSGRDLIFEPIQPKENHSHKTTG